MTFIILALLSLSALALLGAIFFLYRYLMRSHLFPQLPRVWRVEKVRFFICTVVFLLCFGAFLLTGWLGNNSQNTDDTVISSTQPSQNAPSFDNAPPPQQPETTPTEQPTEQQGTTEERVLPPRTDARPETTPATGSASDSSPATSPTTSPAQEKPIIGVVPAQPATPETKPEVKPQNTTTTPETKPETKPQSTPNKPEVKPEVKPESKPETKPEERPVPTPKPYVPEEDVKPQQTVPSGTYTVCVASYATEAAAQSDLKNFANMGQAQIIAADIPGKGRWYRICVGQYSGQAAAQAEANRLRSSGQAKGAFVVRVP